MAAPSATNAWAVGGQFNNLVELWDGIAWQIQKSPNRRTYDGLRGVAAPSPTNAWAVGSYYNGSAYQTLALHCC